MRLAAGLVGPPRRVFARQSGETALSSSSLPSPSARDNAQPLSRYTELSAAGIILLGKKMQLVHHCCVWLSG